MIWPSNPASAFKVGVTLLAPNGSKVYLARGEGRGGETKGKGKGKGKRQRLWERGRWYKREGLLAYIGIALDKIDCPQSEKIEA